MDQYTLIDALTIGLLIISGLLAYVRGLSREVLSIISWLASAIIAFTVSPLVNPYMKAIPILNEIISESCELSILIAFVVSFIASLIFVSLFIPLISNYIQKSSLSGIDRGLGFIFGIARGAIVIIIMLIGHDILTSDNTSFDVVIQSETNRLFSEIKSQLMLSLPETIPSWTAQRYETLISSCNQNLKL